MFSGELYDDYVQRIIIIANGFVALTVYQALF